MNNEIKITTLATILRKTKVIVLGLLGVGFNFLAFYLFYRFLVTAEFSFLWLSAVAILLFLIVFALELAFLRKFSYIAPFTVVAGLIPLVIFIPYLYPVPSYIVLISIALLVFFLLSAAKHGSRLIENSIVTRFFALACRILPKAFIGLLLCMSLIGYFYYVHLGNFSSEIAYAWFGKTLNGTLPVLHLWFPTITFDMTVDEAIVYMSETELRRSRLELLRQGIDIDKLSSSARRELVRQVSAQFEMYFERIAGEELDGELSLRDFFYGIVEGKAANLSSTALELIGSGVIIMLFFALKAVSFLFYIPAAFLAFVIYKLLMLLGFAYITLENKKQEVVVLS